MTKKLKRGDKITVVSVNSCACTTIVEYTIDSIADDGRLVYAKNRKRFFLPITQSSLVLIGHSLGIKEGTYKDGTAFNIDAYCNLGGLDRESMISLLQRNLNETFEDWDMIRWFDGVSEVGDPIFSAEAVSDAEGIEPIEEAEIIEESEPQPIMNSYNYIIPADKRADKKAAATNFRKQLKTAFPDTKFSVKNDHSFYYDVSWADGPTIEEVANLAQSFEDAYNEKLEIRDYSERSFVVIGDTKPIKETLKKLGGRFNCFLTCGAGWVFTKQNNKLDEVKQTLSIA